MADIIKFYGSNAAENPDSVLEQAIGKYEDILILGYDDEGNLDPRASLGLDHANMLWMLEEFKKNLLDGMYTDED